MKKSFERHRDSIDDEIQDLKATISMSHIDTLALIKIQLRKVSTEKENYEDC